MRGAKQSITASYIAILSLKSQKLATLCFNSTEQTDSSQQSLGESLGVFGLQRGKLTIKVDESEYNSGQGVIGG